MEDRRDILKEKPFSYEITKKGQVRVSYHHKHVVTVGHKKSLSMIGKLKHANEYDVQMILAKATGNFKRGNER